MRPDNAEVQISTNGRFANTGYSTTDRLSAETLSVRELATERRASAISRHDLPELRTIVGPRKNRATVLEVDR
jgi:hypothetical protein